MRKARLFQKLNKKNVKCLACQWYCKIAEGNVGICGTRLNKAGDLYSLVYGKAIGLHSDPVEKKPLYHFLPGKRILSFGTVGCNFACLFCQNWEMSQSNKSSKFKVQSSKLIEENLIKLIDKMSVSITPKEIVEMALKMGTKGIAYTYNEPAIFVEFTYDTAKLARKRGLKNIYVSNGFMSGDTFILMKDYLDAINIDLKSFRNDFYTKICKAKIEPVKSNIQKFFQAGIETEVTTLVIPGYNDSEDELKQIAQFLAGISQDIPWHISAFYPSFKLNAPVTPLDKLIQAYKIGKQAGLRYVYIGNIYEEEKSSTFCPKCGETLVMRRRYQTEVVSLNRQKGICKKCGEEIYGIWD